MAVQIYLSGIEGKMKSVSPFFIRASLSYIIVFSYVLLIGALVFIEASDTYNMVEGANSFKDLLKILIGVLTGIVVQVANYWFDSSHRIGGGEKPE